MSADRERVFLSHDGAIDEFLAMAVLAIDRSVELAGVSIVNGDCLAESAMRVQWKLLQLLGLEGHPVSLSNTRGFNPFPWEYRADSARLERVQTLAGFESNPSWPPYPDGEAHLTAELENSIDGGLTLVVTGPLTPVADVLSRRPELESRIRRLVWMGGAIDVPGNLDPKTIPQDCWNPRAEWNAFFDPFAVDWLFRETSFPMTIVPLDCLDQARLSPEFLAKLDTQSRENQLSRFAAEAYRLVADQPFYRMWDVATAAFVVRPELFAQPTRLNLEVGLWGTEQGALARAKDGRNVEAVMRFDDGPTEFYQFVLRTIGGGH